MRVVVAQKGSREHYLVACALHRRDLLARLVVDWYPPFGKSGADFARRIAPAGIARAFGARCDELPDRLITSMRALALASRIKERGAAKRGDIYEAYLQTDAAFGERVSQLSLPDHDAFFGFSYASLEVLKTESQRGIGTMLDQIDPGQTDRRRVAGEAQAWPQYVSDEPVRGVPEAYAARNRQEWEVADVIIVNSAWTRSLIVEDGAPEHKIEVLPLAYECGEVSPPQGRPYTPPLRVLWLGKVTLRKGIPYLVEAARQLESQPVQFTVAGPLHITRSSIQDAPGNMEWLGGIPRSRASQLYREADVFVLPTISDGFAITQIEALAHGRPVIVTPNCGRVVQDGVSGSIVPARDASALAAAIQTYIDEPGKLEMMRPQCLRRAAEFSIDAYGHRLMDIMQRRLGWDREKEKP